MGEISKEAKEIVSAGYVQGTAIGEPFDSWASPEWWEREISNAVAAAHARGREEGIEEVLAIFERDEDGDCDFILHQIRALKPNA